MTNRSGYGGRPYGAEPDYLSGTPMGRTDGRERFVSSALYPSRFGINRCAAMSASELLTNGRLDRFMSNHFSKRLGNMSSSIRRSRSRLDLPIFLDHGRSFWTSRRPRQRRCGWCHLSVTDKKRFDLRQHNGLLGRA